MAMFVLTYLIPSLVLAYCNTRIGFVLWSATELDHQGIPQHQIELLVKKRKVSPPISNWYNINLNIKIPKTG